jgi:uncharacterized repeat protein (TIGR04061 family)
MAPDRLSDFPRDSRSFVRVDSSIRLYWHTLFDICPSLLELGDPEGLEIFRPFMRWAVEREISFGWSYYLWVYRWLRQSEFANRLSEEHLVTLMGASAARWAVSDRSSDCGIVLAARELNGLVVAWKCRTVRKGREVEFVAPQEAIPSPDDLFGFFTVSDFELRYFPGWSSLPR